MDTNKSKTQEPDMKESFQEEMIEESESMNEFDLEQDNELDALFDEAMKPYDTKKDAKKSRKMLEQLSRDGFHPATYYLGLFLYIDFLQNSFFLKSFLERVFSHLGIHKIFFFCIMGF